MSARNRHGISPEKIQSIMTFIAGVLSRTKTFQCQIKYPIRIRLFLLFSTCPLFLCHIIKIPETLFIHLFGWLLFAPESEIAIVNVNPLPIIPVKSSSKQYDIYIYTFYVRRVKEKEKIETSTAYKQNRI